ncbi:PQ-loop-domain-containing protein, partial [Mycena galericulata]
MPANPVAENVLGTIGTVCWTAQIIPQIWKSWREKSTEGLSPWLVLLWGIAAGFLGAYTILLDLNIPLVLQPQLFGFLALVSWGQCQYYSARRPPRTAALMALLAMLLVGAFEAAMVYALRPAAHTEPGVRGVQFLGIFSSVLIALALLPQYAEIYRLCEVVGISVVFMVVDMLGGVFSDLSLAFKDKFDVIAGITYTLVVVLDALVVLAALLLNPRAAKRRRREADAEASTQTEPVLITDVVPQSVTMTMARGPSVKLTGCEGAEHEK